MTPLETLRTARQRGILLSATGDKLQVTAPPGALDGQLRDALGRNKPAILQMLLGPRLDDSGVPVEHCRACGSPNWWAAQDKPLWRCSYCHNRPEPFIGRSVVVASGEWGIH